MIPLFKTHYSVGKSILTPSNIFSFIDDSPQVVFVEDSFCGFRNIFNEATKHKKQLIFGIRLPVIQNSLEERPSKLVFFAKNDEGVGDCKQLFSKTYCSDEKVLKLGDLKPKNLKNIKIGVPFYDSYVYNNVFYFGLSELHLKKFDHFYFEESNNHPFDFQISNALKEVSEETVLAKTILYKNYDDFDAFTMYKAICNRGHGKSPTHSAPNINHLCSNEFCWESFKLNK